MKRLRFLCLAITLATIIIPGPTMGASHCLVLFIGGWKDHKTELMKDLWHDYENIFDCKTKYHGYDDWDRISGDIQRFRNVNERGRVIVVGHSLGGATALAFADSGANHVVTLDAYYPMVDSVIGGILHNTIYRPIIQPIKWFVSLFIPRRKFRRTFWIYVEAKDRRRCYNTKKTGLVLAELAGSGPIDEGDVTLLIEPDDYVYCSNCDHCDVEQMFKQAIPKLRNRL